MSDLQNLEPGALRRQLLACRRCALPAGSRPIASEYLGQRFLLVGQAPGKEEMAKGYPFAGPAGKTLFRWFAEAGLGDESAVRRRMYFTSLARCWPGSRPGSKDDLPPSPAMRANCAGWLAAETALVDPALIVAVGAMAGQAVLARKASLRDLVGPVYQTAWHGGERRVIVLPHPSGLSRWLNDPVNLRLHRAALEVLRQAWQAGGTGAAS